MRRINHAKNRLGFYVILRVLSLSGNRIGVYLSFAGVITTRQMVNIHKTNVVYYFLCWYGD